MYNDQKLGDLMRENHFNGLITQIFNSLIAGFKVRILPLSLKEMVQFNYLIGFTVGNEFLV